MDRPLKVAVVPSLEGALGRSDILGVDFLVSLNPTPRRVFGPLASVVISGPVAQARLGGVKLAAGPFRLASGLIADMPDPQGLLLATDAFLGHAFELTRAERIRLYDQGVLVYPVPSDLEVAIIEIGRMEERWKNEVLVERRSSDLGPVPQEMEIRLVDEQTQGEE